MQRLTYNFVKEIIRGITKCIFGAGLIGAALLIWSNYDMINQYLDQLKPPQYQTNNQNVDKKATNNGINGTTETKADKLNNPEIIKNDDLSNILIIDDNLEDYQIYNPSSDNVNDNFGSNADSNYVPGETSISPTGHWTEAAEYVKPAICRIKVSNYWGSGIIWNIENDHVYVMANKHILEKSNIGYVAFYNGLGEAGMIKTVSAQFDIGIIDVDISKWTDEQKSKIKMVNILEECAANLSEGSEIFMIGSADGVASNISNGSVGNPWYYYEYLDSTYVYAYCRAKPGMSGGGCFDNHGHLVGIISGGNENTEETLCIPVQMLLEMGYR